MKKDPLIFLHHILESIQQIEEYVSGKTLEEFERDMKTQDAVMRRFEVIGEAARNLPNEFRQRYSVDIVDWKKIVGMRDEIIHHYFGVDLTVVWDTIQGDLPVFRDAVQKIISYENAKTSEKEEA